MCIENDKKSDAKSNVLYHVAMLTLHWKIIQIFIWNLLELKWMFFIHKIKCV